MLAAKRKTALDQYMLYGGMPRIVALEDEKDMKAYLSNLYEELYVKDIVERNKLEREDILNAILEFHCITNWFSHQSD